MLNISFSCRALGFRLDFLSVANKMELSESTRLKLLVIGIASGKYFFNEITKGS